LTFIVFSRYSLNKIPKLINQVLVIYQTVFRFPGTFPFDFVVTLSILIKISKFFKIEKIKKQSDTYEYPVGKIAKKAVFRVYFDNMAQYFECQINKNALFCFFSNFFFN